MKQPHALAVLCLCACSGAANGHDPLDPAARSAIVAVGFGKDDPAHCTGVLIAGGRVATARHCLQEDLPWVRLGQDPYNPIAMARGAIEVLDDHRDLLILRVALPNEAAQAVTPLPLLCAPPLVGEPVLLAGFGTPRRDERRRQHIHRGTVKQVEPDRISVRTEGGACLGDSGGPLLGNVRGKLGVYGVLWAGAIDGSRDVYTRLTEEACIDLGVRAHR